MTTQDHQNPENGDNFDRLLANRSQIAEFVNSFTSERVQRKAFEAVVCSLGLANRSVDTDTLPAERLHIVKQDPEVDANTTDEDSGESESVSTPRRRRSRGGARKTFTVPRGLNFAPEGHPSFEAFIAEKSPKNNDEKCLVACYYLSEMMGITEVGIGHILAAYQAGNWSTPAHPDMALRAAASRTGWLDTGDTKAIKVVWKGENYIMTKMPVEPKKKTG